MATTDFLHSFVEEDPEDARAHFEAWFGFPRPDLRDDDEERPVICFCGARREPLGPHTVGVWHRLDYGALREKYEAMGEDW